MNTFTASKVAVPMRLVKYMIIYAQALITTDYNAMFCNYRIVTFIIVRLKNNLYSRCYKYFAANEAVVILS